MKTVVGFTLGVEVRRSGMEAPSTQPPAKNSLDPHLLRCLYPPDAKRRWNEFISSDMDDRQGENYFKVTDIPPNKHLRCMKAKEVDPKCWQATSRFLLRRKIHQNAPPSKNKDSKTRLWHREVTFKGCFACFRRRVFLLGKMKLFLKLA